jgi:hypothetical protein
MMCGDPGKFILISKFSYSLIKLKLGGHLQIGKDRKLLIANHLDQSSWSTDQKQQGAKEPDHIMLHSSLWRVHSFTVTVTSLRKLCTNLLAKAKEDPFVVETDQCVLTFLHSILVCKGMMLLPNWWICHTYPDFT